MHQVKCTVRYVVIVAHVGNFSIYRAVMSEWKNFVVFLLVNMFFEYILPGPNSKSISVLGKSKSKSYLGFQYWASLNTSLKSLPSLNQDLDTTWKLIPKSKPTFQKNSSEIFEFKKIRNVPRFWHYFLATFPGC